MKRFLSIIACLALCFALCVPAFAADIPDIPDLSSEMQALVNKHDLKVFMCYKISGSYFTCLLLRSSDDFIVKDSSSGTSFETKEDTSSIAYAWYEYKIKDNAWTCYGEYPRNSRLGCQSIGTDNIVIESATTATMYYEDGTVFFAPALPPLTEQLQTQAGELTQTQIAETLDFLVPLGIGLLALAASLILLRKVFRTFP